MPGEPMEQPTPMPQTETAVVANPGLNAFLSRLELPRPEDAEVVKVRKYRGTPGISNGTPKILGGDDPEEYRRYREARGRENNETLKQHLPTAIEGITEQLQIDADKLSSTGRDGDAYIAKQLQDILKLLKFEPLTDGGPFGEREERLVLSLIEHLGDSNIRYIGNPRGASFAGNFRKRLDIKYEGEDYDKKPASEEDSKKLEKFYEFDDALSQAGGAIEEKYEFGKPAEGLRWWARRVDPEYYRIQGEKEILKFE